MSQQPPPSGGHPFPNAPDEQYQQEQSRSPGQQRARNPYARDPDTGRFLTDEEAAYVETLARQYPHQVQRAYDQNVSFAAVGLPVPPALGDAGTQVGYQRQPGRPQSPEPAQPQQPASAHQLSQPTSTHQPSQPTTGPQQSRPTGVPQQPPTTGQGADQQGSPQQSRQAGSPQQPWIPASQEQGGQADRYRQPPDGPTSQVAGSGTEQPAERPRAGAGDVQTQPPSEQPQRPTRPEPGPTAQRPADDRPPEGQRIPVRGGGAGQTVPVSPNESGRESRRPENRRWRRRGWYWWYGW